MDEIAEPELKAARYAISLSVKTEVWLEKDSMVTICCSEHNLYYSGAVRKCNKWLSIYYN